MEMISLTGLAQFHDFFEVATRKKLEDFQLKRTLQFVSYAEHLLKTKAFNLDSQCGKQVLWQQQ